MTEIQRLDNYHRLKEGNVRVDNFNQAVKKIDKLIFPLARQRNNLLQFHSLKLTNLCEFRSVLRQINDKAIQNIGFGTYGEAYLVCESEQCNYPFVYKKYKHNLRKNELEEIDSSIYAEIRMNYLMNTFVLGGLTPHINMMVSDVLCEDEKYSIQEYSNLGSLHKYKNLQQVINTQDKFLVMLFQVIYTMAVIINKFPTFRHNDLTPTNILVAKSDDIGKEYIYKLNGTYFKIPGIGIQLRIADFGLACISNDDFEINNDGVIDKEKGENGVSDCYSPYYDVYLFFEGIRYFMDTTGSQDTIVENYIKSLPNFTDKKNPARLTYNSSLFTFMDILMGTNNYPNTIDYFYRFRFVPNSNVSVNYDGDLPLPHYEFNYDQYDFKNYNTEVGFLNQNAYLAATAINPALKYYVDNTNVIDISKYFTTNYLKMIFDAIMVKMLKNIESSDSNRKGPVMSLHDHRLLTINIYLNIKEFLSAFGYSVPNKENVSQDSILSFMSKLINIVIVKYLIYYWNYTNFLINPDKINIYKLIRLPRTTYNKDGLPMIPTFEPTEENNKLFSMTENFTRV